MSIQVFQRVIVFSIAFQLSVGYPLVTYAAGPATSGAVTPNTAPKRKLTQDDFARPIIEQLKLDPVFNEFANSPALPAPEFDSRDNSVDQDPFFLRSQAWSSANTTAGSTDAPSFTKLTDGSLSLNLPSNRSGVGQSLTVRAPLTPVLLTDEYVFLTVDEGRNLSSPHADEGVFFINYQEWLTASLSQSPVHIYFLPLPGNQWSGMIEADHFDDLEVISLGNRNGDWIPVSLADIRQVEKAAALNSLLGMYVAAQSEDGKQQIISGFQAQLQTPSQNQKRAVNNLLPARGSTYGFGSLFTGFDLDHPENSVFNKPKSLSLNFKTKLERLLSLVLPKANADLNVSAELIDRLIRFGWTFGAFTLVSVGLKYSLLRDKFQERHKIQDLQNVKSLEFTPDRARALVSAGIDSRELLSQASSEAVVKALNISADEAQKLIAEAAMSLTAPPSEPTGRIEKFQRAIARAASAITPAPIQRASARGYREVKEVGDALAHVLTIASQIPTVVTANLIERLTDRYTPERAAGSSKLMRKALNYGFYWGRSVSTNTPVSMKTFMLGGVTMGTIDTYFVYFQQVAFIPWATHLIAPHMPPELEQRIYETFDPNNEMTRKLIVNDVIRNFVAWITSGASGYSQDSQAQVEPLVRKFVDDALRKMGKNPLAPEVQDERERLYQDVMNTKLKQLGLPDQVMFLADVNTIDKEVLKQLGFRVSPEARKALGDNVTFVGESRPALIMSALLYAIRLERQALKTNPTAARVKALEILEKTRAELAALNINPLNPVASFKQKRSINSMLSLLTYAGEVNAAIRFVPELWAGIDPDGAKEAAIRFRQAFFAYYNGDSTLIQLPADFVASNLEKAKAEATAELRAKFNIKVDVEKALNTRYQAEFGFLVEQKLRDRFAEQRQAEKIAKFEPPKKSWYEKRQHARAYSRAMEKAIADGASSTSQETLNRYYAEAMANEVGLYPVAVTTEERQLLEYVVLKTTADTHSEMTHPELATYLQNATEADRRQIEISLYAKNYLDTYRSATMDQRLVPPRSPAQPGFTQKFRQSHRDSRLLTILARIVDSGFSDEMGYQTGLKAKLYRNVPGLYDLWSSTTRLGKSIITGTTVRWEYNRVLWGVNIPFASYFLFFLTSPLISAPSQWLNRAFRQQGLEPMGGFFSKVVYGVPYAWVTFGATIPWLLYSNSAMALMKSGTDFVTSSAVYKFITTYGEAALPYLPALILVPIATEIRNRIVNRNAIRAGKRALGLLEIPPGAGSEHTLGTVTGAMTCEMLFSPVAN